MSDGARGAEGADEAAAWAEVERRWGEPAIHQAYVARFNDLAAIAIAGRRYRDALAARPGDPVALAMKEALLRKATVLGLAQLPRSAPPRVPERGWRRRALLLAASTLASALAWTVWRMFGGRGP